MAVENMDQVREKLERGRYPQWAYNDPDIYQLELDHIFAETWCFVGHKTEIPDPGDYVTRYIGEDPFIFIRDEAGEVQVLFNSCRHRGATLCRTESGNTSHFRCPYHGWTYDNGGNLVGVPQKQTMYEGLDTGEWGLEEAPRVDSYRGLVFASLSEEVPPLKDYLGDMTWYLDIVFGFTENGMEVVGEPWKTGSDYNWKSGVENSCSDNYHFITTHQSALDATADDEPENNPDPSPHPFVSLDGAVQASMFLMPEDQDYYFGYSDEIIDCINPELNSDQIDLARRARFFNGVVFPNMTVVQFASKRKPNTPSHPNLLVRLHRPLSHNRTESWKWLLVPREASEEYRSTLKKAFQSSFGSTGLVEPDDQAAWERVTEPASSVFARKRDLELNFEAGMEDISGGIRLKEEFPGPGQVTDGQMVDLGLRKFHWMWYNEMSGDDTEVHRTTIQ